jgi:hypothetical protein
VPFPVGEAVSVGSKAATRYLVQGVRRTPRSRILVLSDRATRLFEAVRDEVDEVLAHGFPFAADIIPRDRRAVAGRFALPPGRDDKELWRNFYRQVDAALTDAVVDDPVPIVLAGVQRSTGLFAEVSRNMDDVIAARLDGAYDKATAHALGEVAWPVMRAYLEVRRGQAIEALTDGVHRRKAVTGIDEVWQLGREGRGRLLVVEEDYRAEPSREIDGRLVAANGDRTTDVIPDPVDDLIEHVVRAGGTVEFVAAGGLAAFGHIGLLLR